MTPFQLNDWMRSDTWDSPTFDDVDILKPGFDVIKDPGFLSMVDGDFMFPEVTDNTSSFNSDSVSSSYDDAMTDMQHHCDSTTSSPLSEDDHSLQDTSLQSAQVPVSELLSEPHCTSPVPDVSLLLESDQLPQQPFLSQQPSTSQYFCPNATSAGLLASTFPLQQAALTCADLLAHQARPPCIMSPASWPLAAQLQKTIATNALAVNYFLNSQLPLLQSAAGLLQPGTDCDSSTSKAQPQKPTTETSPSPKAGIKSQGSSSGPLSAWVDATHGSPTTKHTEIKPSKARKTTVIIHKPPMERPPCPKRAKVSSSAAPAAADATCPPQLPSAAKLAPLAAKASPCSKPQRLLQRPTRQPSGVAAAVVQRRATATQLPSSAPAIPAPPKPSAAASKAEAQSSKVAGPKKRNGKRKNGKSSRKGIPRKSQDVVCLNCGTQQTPQWRRGPDGPRTLCNACGVRFKKGLPLPYLALQPAQEPVA